MGKGAILVFCGMFIIGMVDNVLRPILVGRDTRMPDFVVLIATLSGLELFGLNGFVIGPVIAALFMAVWTQQRGRRLAMAETGAAPGAASSAGTTPEANAEAHPS